MNKKLICKAPFTEVEIDQEGNVNCCCKQYTNDYIFGNIFQQPFEEIWNGEKAKIFRKDIIEGKYSYCNIDKCNFGRLKPTRKKLKLDAPYPRYVTIACDEICNLMCITCRDKIIRNTSTKYEDFDKNIDKYYIDICKNAEELILNPIGESLLSKYTRTLILKVIEKYPNVQFNIMTNGTVCNEIVLKNLGLINRLAAIQVSIHAATKETYNKITRTGNFDTVLKNLKWLSEEKKKGNIICVIINFVVHSINYKEMAAFCQLAKDLNIEVTFWEFQNWNCTEMDKNYHEYTVWERNHPEFNNFLEILKDPVFDYEQCNLIPLFHELRKEALSKV